MNYILGIDLGTSSLKGVVFDQDGNFIGAKVVLMMFAIPKKDIVNKTLNFGLMLSKMLLRN
ncbi:hypothetical protein [Anaerococcus obesiensis]|uniref:hypothetical protein n=1 Tax=Anaerococcus obesiensis TaxID=1287640 RepID=UPI001F37FE17|nr:hypothetical protein [Anaerococcus obesiensis]